MARKKKSTRVRVRPKQRQRRHEEAFDVRYETDKGEETIRLRIIRPTSEQLDIAQAAKNRAFASAVGSKALLRAKLEDFMKEQGLWDDAKDAELATLRRRIRNNERQLAEGGIRLTQARGIAMELTQARADVMELLSPKHAYDNLTAESQGDQAQFNYLVSVCTVYDRTEQRVFKDIDDYANYPHSEVSFTAAQQYSQLYYGLDPNYETNLPENAFLHKFGFMDDKLRLINADGHYINAQGQLVNEFGLRVNEKEEYIDEDGSVLDDQGQLVVDVKPFLSDKDEEIIEEEESEESEESNNEGETQPSD